MIWVGSFKSLQSRLPKLPFTDEPLEVHTWVQSEIGQISPLVDWLMNLIAASGCVRGEEQLVELALREALSNAILHGNRRTLANWFTSVAAAKAATECSSSSEIRDKDSIPIRFPILWRSKISVPNTGAGST
jgi:hypothetical protein